MRRYIYRKSILRVCEREREREREERERERERQTDRQRPMRTFVAVVRV